MTFLLGTELRLAVNHAWSGCALGVLHATGDRSAAYKPARSAMCSEVVSTERCPKSSPEVAQRVPRTPDTRRVGVVRPPVQREWRGCGLCTVGNHREVAPHRRPALPTVAIAPWHTGTHRGHQRLAFYAARRRPKRQVWTERARWLCTSAARSMLQPGGFSVGAGCGSIVSQS